MDRQTYATALEAIDFFRLITAQFPASKNARVADMTRPKPRHTR